MNSIFKLSCRATAFSMPATVAIFMTMLVACPQPIQAQENVVAKVGDIEITERDLAFAQADLEEQFAQVPEELRKAAILNALIDIKLLALLAKDSGIEDTEQFKARMQFLRDRALHNSYFQEKVLEAVTDDEVKARYEAEIAAMKPESQIRARHILVKTEEEARAVIGEIEAGKPFEEAAKEHSTGPTGPNGGDLGFFGKGQMVPEFEQAAFALGVGEITKDPVQTQFGWHVIKKEEERTQPPPEFEAVQSQVRQVVMREKYTEIVRNAREAQKVEILDETLRKQLEEQGSEPSGQNGE